MKITVLGSGTSSGVPMIGCTCHVCTSSNPKNNRLRSSCLFQVDGKNILIDTSPDFRQQALREGIQRIDAVLYTHIHADHIHGIDELRMFNAIQKESIPVYGDDGTINHLKKHFRYIFGPSTTTVNTFIPRLEPHIVSGNFEAADVSVQMIPCNHGPDWFTYNYRIGNAAWLTDTSGIPESSMELLQDLDILFLDGLRPKPHPTHFHTEAALEAAAKIGAKKTYLIHLTHDHDHDEANKMLPNDIELAYDGLVVELE